MGRLLIKYPTRSRPKEFLFALDKYRNLVSGKHEVYILISADADDVSMQSWEIRNMGLTLWNEYGHTVSGQINYGNSKSKIEACNADIDKIGDRFPDWDVVLLASDDMIPQVEGYDDIIMSEMNKHFPDTDGMLFFSDGTNCWNSNLCTIAIFGRKYYERFGYLYHPNYVSFWCDNEQTEVGQTLGKIAKIDQVIIKNEHPVHRDLTTGQNGTFANDQLYKRNNRFFKEDQRTYERRKALNFGLSIPAPVETTAPEVSTAPVLSILIPTIPERKEVFENLYSELTRQTEPYGDQIEIVVNATPKIMMTIGAKRNELYRTAKGIYSVQIDDDDGIPTDYVEKIMEALKQSPDFVGYRELCIMDGEPKYSCHSNRFFDWGQNIDGFHYVRTPFFKDVIKTEICRHIKVDNIRFGEDHRWSKALKRSGLIQKEVFIDEIMYFYIHDTLTLQQHRDRYGL